MTESLSQLILRDLGKLQREIESYRDEQNLWIVSQDISNTAGNLCLHLVGNLRHFIGHILGGAPYTRDRHGEFNDKNISRERLVELIGLAQSEVSGALSGMGGEDLSRTYPLAVFGHDMTTEYFLIHLHGHLNYHLGQINYHRRLLDV